MNQSALPNATMPEYQVDRKERSRAIIAMLAAGLFFALMGISTRATHIANIVGTPIPALEVTCFRFAIGVAILLPLQGRNGVNLLGNNRRRLVFRGIIGSFAVLFYFMSLQNTSIMHAQLLNYGSLFFAPFFALHFLKEKITVRTGMAITIAIAGMALILSASKAGGQTFAGDCYGLISGILAGGAITEIRLLRQTESSLSIFFYLSLIGIFITLPLMLWFHPIWPTTTGWFYLLLMGISSCTAQLLMTFGYKYVRAAEGSLLTMTQIAYVSIASLFVFHEHFTFATIGGALLILGSAYWLSAKGTN